MSRGCVNVYMRFLRELLCTQNTRLGTLPHFECRGVVSVVSRSARPRNVCAHPFEIATFMMRTATSLNEIFRANETKVLDVKCHEY